MLHEIGVIAFESLELVNFCVFAVHAVCRMLLKIMCSYAAVNVISYTEIDNFHIYTLCQSFKFY